MTAPRLADWVELRHPMSTDAPWIVERRGANPLRVSADVGHLLAALDGRRDHAALAEVLGTRWTAELVNTAVRQFTELGLLHSEHAEPPPPERRVLWVSAGMLQFRIFPATRVLDPLRPLLTRLRGSAVLLVTVLLGSLGIFALVWQGDSAWAALGEPLPLATMAGIWLGLGLTTVFHELGHGATLTHYRGRPGWFGLMLFYLTPACFCEVTDAWRLPRRGQRVAVALAGVGAQAATAGTAAVVASFLPAGDVRTALTGFAVVCYLAGLVNFVPWVRLDGYLALMSWLDLPHLREKSIADARSWWFRLLFGQRVDRQLPGRRWVVPFGVLCAAFPTVVLLLALGRWSRTLLPLGMTGGILVLLLVGYLAYRLVRTGWQLLADARAGGAGWVRLASVLGLAALVVGVPLATIQVPHRLAAGYVREAGQFTLVLPPGTDPAMLTPGAAVVLRRDGVLLGTEVGRAVVDNGTPRPGQAPAEALTPIRSTAAVPVLRAPLREVTGSPNALGTAFVQLAPVSAGEWLYDTYLAPALAEIF